MVQYLLASTCIKILFMWVSLDAIMCQTDGVSRYILYEYCISRKRIAACYRPCGMKSTGYLIVLEHRTPGTGLCEGGNYHVCQGRKVLEFMESSNWEGTMRSHCFRTV